MTDETPAAPQGMWDKMKGWFTRAKDSETAEKAAEVAGKAWEKTKDVADKAWDKTKDVADELRDKVEDKLEERRQAKAGDTPEDGEAPSEG
jgi:hypothetical protein